MHKNNKNMLVRKYYVHESSKEFTGQTCNKRIDLYFCVNVNKV